MTTAFHNIPDYVSRTWHSPSIIESLASTCKCSFTTCNEKSISSVLNVLNIIVTIMHTGISIR